MGNINMHDMPVGERPYERLAQVGEHGLSSAELLAIVLRRGMPGQSVTELANDVLSTFGGITGIAKATRHELQQVRGIGPAKAMEIKAALELGRRLLATAPHERPQIKAPADAANLLMSEMAFLDQEQLRVLLLDTKHCVQKITTVYIGSLNMALVRVGEIFRDALKVNAQSIVLAHNHPSGDPTPSGADVRMTKQVVEAGKLLDIEVLDHVIIGRNKFVSLKELGLGF